VPNHNGSVMRLETSDSAWLASLADSIDSIAYSDLRLQGIQVIIQRNQHTRIHRQSQIKQEIMVFPAVERLHVGCSIDSAQQASEGYI